MQRDTYGARHIWGPANHDPWPPQREINTYPAFRAMRLFLRQHARDLGWVK